MRYAYHFEFCERPELPEWLREDVFASLAWVQGVTGLREALRKDVSRLFREACPPRVVELGAGSGDGLREVALNCPELEFVLTDKYPAPLAWQKNTFECPNIKAFEAPVAFEDFDRVLPAAFLSDSVLLLTAAFHHIAREQARSFLERASRAGASICVVEPLERSIWGVFLGATCFVPSLAFPFVALLRVGKLGLRRVLRIVLLHWMFPVVPAILAHDGVVSAFRQRTREDWDILVRGLSFSIEQRRGLGLFRNFSIVFLRRGNF